MENFDAFTIFISGLALGVMLGHWIGKHDRQLAYDRGRCDGIAYLWPHLAAYWVRDLCNAGRPAGDTSDSAGPGNKEPVREEVL